VLPEKPPPVTVLGVDETRRGKAYEIDLAAGEKTWVDRFDTGLFDLSGNGGLFAQVNGRISKVLIEWLQAQDPDWLATITHVSVETSATYARAAASTTSQMPTPCTPSSRRRSRRPRRPSTPRRTS
jgi:transposase